MSKLSNNDKAWSLLFEHFDIINKIKQNGQFEVTANEIKEIGKREPRLMAKFDSKANLPILFHKYHLSILPISRGSYIIAPFETYYNFPIIDDIKPESFKFPEHIESIDLDNITGETAAINSAYLSGMIADFVGDEMLFPTVNGRMSSNSFEFKINDVVNKKQLSLFVQNSQIEIDAAYEGLSTLSIIEAKNNISDDFLVRQLYYPFRRWQGSVTKQVKTIFVVYSNNVFSLYEYHFDNVENYNSIRLAKFKKYCFEPLDITIVDIQNLIDHVVIEEEPTSVPFPQADNFARVINLCELLREESLTKEEITLNYDFDSRQTDYYFNAGKYLGLFELSEHKIHLTEKALSFFTLSSRARQLEFVKLIIQHRIFNLALKSYFEKSQPPTNAMVVEIMKTYGLNKVGTNYEYADSTYGRRADTVIGWVNWILALTR